MHRHESVTLGLETQDTLLQLKFTLIVYVCNIRISSLFDQTSYFNIFRVNLHVV